MKFDPWEIKENNLVFSAAPWFEVFKQTVELPGGQLIDDYYQIEQPDYSEIVALNDQRQVRMVWHYKHGVRKTNLGLPAGYLEKNEDPLHAAQRELAEECLLESSDWVKLGAFNMEGNRSTSKVHIYLAFNCQSSKQNLISDDLEEYQLQWLSIPQCLQHIADGNIAVIGAATSILLANNELIRRGLL